MNEVEQVPNSAEGKRAWIERVLEGGIPALFLSKPIQEAIAKLIGVSVDYLVLGMEEKNQRRRDNIAAQSKVTVSISEGVSKAAPEDPAVIARGLAKWASMQSPLSSSEEAVRDPAMVERAMLRDLSDRAKKQETREDVAFRSMRRLVVDPPITEPRNGPSDDFMNAFGAFAENASSESLRDIFARILAGEMRNPGSISLRTLHVVATMDQLLAVAAQRTSTWIMGHFIPLLKDLSMPENYEMTTLLAEAGMLRKGFGLIRTFTFGDKGRIVLPFGLPANATQALVIYGTSGSSVKIETMELTGAGKEIFSVISDAALPSAKIEIAQWFKEKNGIVSVSLGDIQTEQDGSILVFNEHVVT